MDRHLLLTVLRRYWIEIKYTIILLVLVGGLFWLVSYDVFDGVERRVNTAMDRLAEYGAVGMFLIALPSNMSLVFVVPYNLPMFSLLLYVESVWEVVWLGTTTGVGAGIGELLSYAVAHAIVARVEDIEDSALFRWTRRTIDRRPGLIPLLVWLASATPVPDLALIVPVALVKYPWRKMIIPMISGKIVQNVVVAFIFYYAADSASHLVSRDINFDLAALIVLLFVLVIAYQIEKAHAAEQNAGHPDE